MVKNSLMILLAAVALAACGGGMQLQNAKDTGPGGSPFNFNLYEGYIALSQAEYDEGDYEDSDFFAMRAMTASKGGKVKPDGFKARKIPDDKVAELRRARGKLMIALAQGAREDYPNLAANAQVKFDCWMQEQEENLQPEDIAACRAGFMKTMDKLQKAMAPKPMAMKEPMKKMPMAKEPEPAEVEGIYIVFFDFNSDKLNPAARQELDKVVKEFKMSKSYLMTLTGHADMAGASKYNEALSKKRLATVSSYLLDKGVPRNALLPTAFGEMKPLVPTKNGMREKRNRRVEIIFE